MENNFQPILFKYNIDSFTSSYIDTITYILNYSYPNNNFSTKYAHISMQIIRSNSDFLTSIHKNAIKINGEDKNNNIHCLSYILKISQMLRKTVDECYPDNHYNSELAIHKNLKCYGTINSLITFNSVFKDSYQLVNIDFLSIIKEQWKFVDIYQYCYPNKTISSENSHVGLQVILQKMFILNYFIKDIITNNHLDNIDSSNEKNNLKNFLNEILAITNDIIVHCQRPYNNDDYNIEIAHKSLGHISEKIKDVASLLSNNSHLFLQPIDKLDNGKEEILSHNTRKNSKLHNYSL